MLNNPSESIIADLSTLETRLSAVRAGYLDELDFDLQSLLNAIAAYLTTEIADILTDTGSTLPGLLSAIQADLDNPTQFMANLTTIETRLSAVRAGYLDQLDFALQEAIAAIPTTMVGTDNAALASAWTSALATALGNYTAARAGYLEELAAANIPADVDELITSKGRQLFTMDFWSDVGEEVVVTGTQSTVTAGLNNVVVADLPAGATIVRAVVMMKFRMVENTYAGINKLDAAAALPMQLDDVANTGMLTCLDFADDLFTFSEAAREGGDIIIGDIDVSARVDANDTYDFQWLNAKADQNNINFNDVQMGLRIWYSV